jgi:hypothetical protein
MRAGLKGKQAGMAGSVTVRVLMCTLDGADWLEAQLDSLLAQTRSDWRLWVSDDGSRDDTRAILRRFAEAHPGRLERLVDGPRRGAAANYLHLLCHPDLPPGPVALADQDDVWRPGKLARAMDAIAAAEAGGAGAVAYAAGYDVVDSAGRFVRRVSAWPHGPSFGNALVQNIMSGHTLTLNADALALLRRVGPRDVPHHDWFIYQLMAGAGARLCLDPEPVLDYRQHGANAFGDRRSLAAALRRARLVGRGAYAGWIAANCATLASAREMLTPEACRTLALVAAAPDAPRGLRRVVAMARAGLRRQQAAETALLRLAAALGKA